MQQPPLNGAAIGSDLAETSFALRLQLSAKRPRKALKRTGSRARARPGIQSFRGPPWSRDLACRRPQFPRSPGGRFWGEREQNTGRLLYRERSFLFLFWNQNLFSHLSFEVLNFLLFLIFFLRR